MRRNSTGWQRAAQAHAAKTAGAPPAAIGVALYEAKFADDQLIGEASMNIILTGSAPAMLPFETCNLALDAVSWAPPEGQPTKAPQRAALGLSADGKQELMVERSGRLTFKWSLDGRRDPGDVATFSLELPAAPANRLILELPDNATPVLDHGMIVESEPVGERGRRWRIELGGNHRFHLRVVAAGAIGHRHQLALLRESQTYDVSLRGLEVSALWSLQVHNEPLQQIAVLLDPGLQLASARCGDAAVPWSTAPAADGQATRIVLSLPEPIRDVERVIRLVALGPTLFDQPWRLPRLCAEGLFWQEGDITLLLPDPVVADGITPVGCDQTGTGPLSAPRSGESAQFQSFGPESTVELRLSQRPSRVRMLGAAAIELGDEEATARVAVSLQSLAGARSTVDADVAKPWIIDGIETAPAGAVADWTVEPRSDGGQLLSMRLSEALSPARPLSLRIAARRVFLSATEKLGIDDLWPLRFSDIADAKQLISLRSTGSSALQFSGDEHLVRLGADSLTPAELRLFRERPGDRLFLYDAQAKALAVSLVGQRAKYGGATRVEAAAGDRLLGLNADEPAPSRAWAWNCHLESWYQSDGTVRHSATYDIENCGRDSFRLVLPRVAREDIRGVWLDGNSGETRIVATDGQCAVTVDLPAGRKFPSVAIQWIGVGPRLGISGSLAAALPEADLPVLARHWTAWLPSGYEYRDSPTGALPVSDTEMTWARRLFGPFGRTAGAQPFNPFSLSDWKAPLADHWRPAAAAADPAAPFYRHLATPAGRELAVVPSDRHPSLDRVAHGAACRRAGRDRIRAFRFDTVVRAHRLSVDGGHRHLEASRPSSALDFFVRRFRHHRYDVAGWVCANRFRGCARRAGLSGGVVDSTPSPRCDGRTIRVRARGRPSQTRWFCFDRGTSLGRASVDLGEPVQRGPRRASDG